MMSAALRVLLPAVLLAAAAGEVACSSGADGAGVGVRPPAVADRFYPGSAAQLRGAIESFLETAVPPLGLRPVALIAPHAGYVFSGQIAADAYRQVQPGEYDVVVILGTCHTVAGFRGVSVYPGEGYRTPLGVAATDAVIAQALLGADPAIRFEPEAHAREHSVEVQVPFVQVVMPDAKIVGAVVGALDAAAAERVGRALATVLRHRRPLIVASTDLSHYPRADDARRVDLAVLGAMASMRPEAVRAAIERLLQEGVAGLSTCACGEEAVLVALHAARALGATQGTLLSYAHSGNTVFGESGRVVGYGAVAFASSAAGGASAAGTLLPVDPNGDAGSGTPPAAGSALTQADRDSLLRLARQTVTQYLHTGTVPLPRAASAALRQPRGVFVTFHRHGALRGCIGHMAEDTPLQLATARMALEAAQRDPRFRPMSAAELPEAELLDRQGVRDAWQIH